MQVMDESCGQRPDTGFLLRDERVFHHLDVTDALSLWIFFIAGSDHTCY